MNSALLLESALGPWLSPVVQIKAIATEKHTELCFSSLCAPLCRAGPVMDCRQGISPRS